MVAQWIMISSIMSIYVRFSRFGSYLMLSLIYARSENFCIGSNGQLPWYLPDEYNYFKKMTMGKPIIMGRKTYEDHGYAFPNQLNIMISTQTDYQPATGVKLVHSLENAIELAKQTNAEYFVIGGAVFFKAAFPLANTVYETVVESEVDGDTFVAEFDFCDWETEVVDRHEKDHRHQYAYTIYKYTRK